MRSAYLLLALICLLIASQGLLRAQMPAQAPATPPAAAPAVPPNHMDGALLAKHIAAGLNCSACHAENPPSKAADPVGCLNCHGPNDALVASTAADEPNPHAVSHIGEIPCTECHHVHKPSEVFCNNCHSYDLTMP